MSGNAKGRVEVIFFVALTVIHLLFIASTYSRDAVEEYNQSNLILDDYIASILFKLPSS